LAMTIIKNGLFFVIVGARVGGRVDTVLFLTRISQILHSHLTFGIFRL